MSWGAGTVYVKWARVDLDPLALAFWQLVIAFLVIAACLLAFDGRLNLDHAHAGSLLATAYAGVIGSGIAYALWFEIMRRLPAGHRLAWHSGHSGGGRYFYRTHRRRTPDRRRHHRVRADFCRLRLRSVGAVAAGAPFEKGYRLTALRQFGDARHHRVARIGERVEDGEVVAGQFGVAGLGVRLPPGIGHVSALALELA